VRFRFSLVVSLYALSGGASHAVAEDIGASLAKAFVGGCLQVLPNTDRIAVSAKALGWKTLEGDMAAMFAPQEKSAVWQGWLVNDGDGPPYIMFISEGPFMGKQMKMCGVANPYAPYDEVVPTIIEILALGKEEISETNLGQRTTVWNHKDGERDYYISVVDSTPMKEPGLNISAFTEMKE
jgi:hypothetical protein